MANVFDGEPDARQSADREMPVTRFRAAVPRAERRALEESCMWAIKELTS